MSDPFTSPRILPKSEVLPMLREAIAALAEAIDDYIIEKRLPGSGDRLAVEVATTKARNLFKNWCGGAIQPPPEKLEWRGFRRAWHILLPSNNDEQPMGDGDFYEKFGGTTLATPKILAELRQILVELGPEEHLPSSPEVQAGATQSLETNVVADGWCDRITLDQAAAVVHKSKRTLERLKTAGKLPSPSVEGGGGKADLWDWPIIGPWLSSHFGINLPDRFPATR